jgi:hypothetical protein
VGNRRGKRLRGFYYSSAQLCPNVIQRSKEWSLNTAWLPAPTFQARTPQSSVKQLLTSDVFRRGGPHIPD